MANVVPIESTGVGSSSTPSAPMMTMQVSKGSIINSPILRNIFSQVTSVKLDQGNFLLWQNLALPILHSYKLEGYLTSTNISTRVSSSTTSDGETGLGFFLSMPSIIAGRRQNGHQSSPKVVVWASIIAGRRRRAT
ncbi:hypothetical protein Q3G72_016759 [Acer saccharum]|nr:hypothetical protein Q3G72_016759 [Acer saccharum]